MSSGSQYFWVVLCKNRSFHRQQNLYFGHTIPLAETDAILSPPSFKEQLRVKCDDCGREYSYDPKELLRTELDPPEGFVTHPLFVE